MVTPLTQEYFNFGELENSVMYCVCGLEVIAGFVFVRWISKKVEERVVLSIGLFLANISCVWCLIFLANPQGEFFSVGLSIYLSVLLFSLFLSLCTSQSQQRMHDQYISPSEGMASVFVKPL